VITSAIRPNLLGEDGFGAGHCMGVGPGFDDSQWKSCDRTSMSWIASGITSKALRDMSLSMF